MSKKESENKNGITTTAAKREKTRLRLKTTARRIFSKKGYENANVSDIVGEIDMAQGTFYYHFNDKKSVLVEMLEDFFAEVRMVMENWAKSTDAGPEAAESFGASIANIFYINREVAMIMKHESSSPDREIRSLIDGFYSYLYTQTRLGLELGISLGLVRPMDTAIVAPALVGMIEKVVEEQVKKRKKPDFDHVIREMMELQNHGIRPR